MQCYWNRSLNCIFHKIIISLPASLGGAPGEAAISPLGQQLALRLPVPTAVPSWSLWHIWLLVFDAWYPQRNYGIGYNYACSGIIGLDINILATCEESLFLFTVYHLAAVHPFLTERVKSTVPARGETGVKLEALNKQLLHILSAPVMGQPGQESQDDRQQLWIRSGLFFPCPELGRKLSQASSDLPKS